MYFNHVDGVFYVDFKRLFSANTTCEVKEVKFFLHFRDEETLT